MMVFILDITIRYVVMLGEFLLESLRALRLRSVGKNSRKYASVSGLAGPVFLKSRRMAVETHGAMACRGFTGEYRVVQKFSFTAGDLGYILVHIAMIGLYFYLR
jgi:cobalt/nickel transport system permease protein